MSYSRPDENTLGIILGRGKRREAAATGRVIRAATPERSSLGIGFIAVGAAILVALRAVYGIVWLGLQWDLYPDPLIALGAWLVLLAMLVAGIAAARSAIGEIPAWMFIAYVAGLLGVMVTDFTAVWPLHDVGRHATAATAAGMALVVVVTVRRTADILIATGILGASFLVAVLLDTAPDSENYAPQVTAVAFVVLPSVIGVVVVRGFRKLVQVELDRVLVQSTVSAPRFAVGMMASEELARLDLAAEDLLESVSAGKTLLPLNPKMASIAASLATELRLHLIEGRRETWLHHAISESDLLGRAVTLIDKGSLAGLLDARQRDGLLSAVWLLISDTRGSRKSAARSVVITVGPVLPTSSSGFGVKITVPVVLAISGLSRNRIDPAMWEVLGKMGHYSDSADEAGLRVDVVCLVDNPADQ